MSEDGMREEITGRWRDKINEGKTQNPKVDPKTQKELVEAYKEGREKARKERDDEDYEAPSSARSSYCCGVQVMELGHTVVCVACGKDQ